MDDTFLASLRCPIDPKREATFTRDQQSLVCSGCQCRFPVKQGLPVLIPDEAELPEGIAVIGQLPCVSASRQRRRGN